jgi:hypothetical protein
MQLTERERLTAIVRERGVGDLSNFIFLDEVRLNKFMYVVQRMCRKLIGAQPGPVRASINLSWHTQVMLAIPRDRLDEWPITVEWFNKVWYKLMPWQYRKRLLQNWADKGNNVFEDRGIWLNPTLWTEMVDKPYETIDMTAEELAVWNISQWGKAS